MLFNEQIVQTPKLSKIVPRLKMGIDAEGISFFTQEQGRITGSGDLRASEGESFCSTN